MSKVRKLEPRGHVVPALDTPTDLEVKAVEEISQALNGLLADTFALYLKTKNFHWHVSGPHFRDCHLLLDEQAGQLENSIDILAERVRRIGDDPFARHRPVARNHGGAAHAGQRLPVGPAADLRDDRS